jgi:hypothetical protein
VYDRIVDTTGKADWIELPAQDEGQHGRRKETSPCYAKNDLRLKGFDLLCERTDKLFEALPGDRFYP